MPTQTPNEEQDHPIDYPGGDTTGGAGTGRNDAHGSGIEYRLTTAAGLRKELPSNLCGAATWTIEPNGGYADFSLPVFLDTDTNAFPGVDAGDVLDVFNFGVRQFRGKVTDLTASEEEPPTLSVAGYGRIIDLEALLLSGDYQYPDAVDISVIFGEVASDVQARYPDIVIFSEFVGVSTNNVEGTRKTAREVLATLYNFVSAVACIGFDVDPSTGRDRLYLRKKSSSTNHKLSVPGAQTGKREKALHISDLVTVVTITGDAPDAGQLLPNSSFEVAAKLGDGGGNLIENPSYEDGSGQTATEWTLTNGAGRQQNDPAPHTGSVQISLDGIGEAVSQTQEAPIIDLVPGRDYTFSFWARPEQNAVLTNPPVVEGRLWWRRADGSFYSAQILQAAPVTLEYKQFEKTIRCPSDATGFMVQLVQTGGSTGGGKGILLDDVAFYDATRLVPQFWDTRVFGSAQINALNWRARNAFHGRSCLFIDASAQDVNGQDVAIRCTPDYRFNVAGGQKLRFSLLEKTLPGETAPKQMRQIQFYDKDGKTITSTKVYLTPSAPFVDWTYLETIITVPAAAVQAEAWINVRGSGRFFLDALSVRLADDNETLFLEAGNLVCTFRADDLVSSAENVDVHDSINRYGLREKVVSVGGIKSIADARAVAKNYLLDNASDVPAPVLDVYDYDKYLWVGDAAQLVGDDAGRYADRVLPVARINGSTDGNGLMTHQVELRKVKLTEQELYAGLAKKTSNQIAAAAGAQAASMPTGAQVTGASAAGVSSIKGIAGDVDLVGAGGVDVSASAQTITASLSASGVAPGSYTNANITVDAKGRVTSAASGSAGSGGTSSGVSSLNTATGDVTIAAGTGVGISRTGGTITISATGSDGSGGSSGTGSGTVGVTRWTGNSAAYAGSGGEGFIVVDGNNTSSLAVAFEQSGTPVFSVITVINHQNQQVILTKTESTTNANGTNNTLFVMAQYSVCRLIRIPTGGGQYTVFVDTGGISQTF